jgi:hypothetical protein
MEGKERRKKRFLPPHLLIFLNGDVKQEPVPFPPPAILLVTADPASTPAPNHSGILFASRVR